MLKARSSLTISIVKEDSKTRVINSYWFAPTFGQHRQYLYCTIF